MTSIWILCCTCCNEKHSIVQIVHTIFSTFFKKLWLWLHYSFVIYIIISSCTNMIKCHGKKIFWIVLLSLCRQKKVTAEIFKKNVSLGQCAYFYFDRGANARPVAYMTTPINASHFLLICHAGCGHGSGEFGNCSTSHRFDKREALACH